MSNTPSDAEVLALAQQHLKAFAQFTGAGEVWFEGEVEFARAVLAKWGTPPAVAGEPFAWADDGSLRSGSTATAHRVVTHETKMGMPKAAADSFNTPLYLTPQPTQAQAGAVPLTDGQIARIYERYGGDMINCTRSIERHHGIRGGQHVGKVD